MVDFKRHVTFVFRFSPFRLNASGAFLLRGDELIQCRAGLSAIAELLVVIAIKLLNIAHINTLSPASDVAAMQPNNSKVHTLWTLIIETSSHATDFVTSIALVRCAQVT